MDTSLTEIALLGAIILGIVALFVLILTLKQTKLSNRHSRKRSSEENAPICIVVGSGGHTSEILRLVKHLGPHYCPRYYVMANTDKMSEEKVVKLEAEKSDRKDQYKIYKIPRSREVKQSWFTTVLTTAYSCLYSFPLIFKLRPEIILCNGPGTCIPLCLAGLILKLFFYPVKIIYVESICRVETLSLSGKILYHLADNVIVQWKQLQEKYPKTQYIGRVV